MGLWIIPFLDDEKEENEKRKAKEEDEVDKKKRRNLVLQKSQQQQRWDIMIPYNRLLPSGFSDSDDGKSWNPTMLRDPPLCRNTDANPKVERDGLCSIKFQDSRG